MLPARHRLTDRADFAATIRGRGTTRHGSRLLVVHARPADATPTDARASCSRVAIERGTPLAEVLRAQAAEVLPSLPPGTDLVIRANPAAAEAGSSDLGAALRHCLRHLEGGRG